MRKSASDADRIELRVYWPPVLAELLPPLDEHPEVLADQPPGRNTRSVRRPVAGQRCFPMEPPQDVICGDLNALATGLLGRLNGFGNLNIPQQVGLCCSAVRAL